MLKKTSPNPNTIPIIPVKISPCIIDSTPNHTNQTSNNKQNRNEAIINKANRTNGSFALIRLNNFLTIDSKPDAMFNFFICFFIF